MLPAVHELASPLYKESNKDEHTRQSVLYVRKKASLLHCTGTFEGFC